MPEDHSRTTYEELAKNQWRTLWLMMLFPAMLATITLIACVVFAFVNQSTQDTPVDLTLPFVQATELFLDIVPFVTIGATIWVCIALLTGKRMILAFAGAKPIEKRDHPELFRTVENMAIQVGIQTPKIYIIEDASLNAFATGYSPKNAAVAITRGLLQKLDKTELEAVMAHEFGHILHRDIRVMLVAVTMVGILQLAGELILRIVFRHMLYSRGSNDRKGGGAAVIVLIVGALLIWFISFLGSVFVQMGISRRREFMADAESVQITRNPSALVSALQKITADPRVEVLDGKRTVAALCIADPLSTKQSFFDSVSGLFRTHPPVEKRIAALRQLGG